MNMDILFIQHGDYGEVHINTLRKKHIAQFRSVESGVKNLAATKSESFHFALENSEQLESNLWSIGIEKNNHLKKALYQGLHLLTQTCLFVAHHISLTSNSQK